jgi:Ca2+-binding RTX toxin-like protein
MARRILRRRTVLPALLACALLALAATLAAGLPGSGSVGPRLRLLSGGAIAQSNSKDGRAILSALDLAPGGTAQGTVTIGNTGSAPGYLGLSASDLTDSPGVGGGVVSRAAHLTVTDVTGGSDAVVYGGRFDSMPYVDLVTLLPGDERTYRFAVSVPDGGVSAGEWEGDNALQRAAASVTYEWTLTQSGDSRCGSDISGGSGGNTLDGTMGGDRIAGGGGADAISGRAGDDCILGGPGPDVIRGGPGDDTIRSRGGGRDSVNCGAGNDVAVSGRRDRVRRCETVELPGR